jgi:hypothetical protein
MPKREFDYLTFNRKPEWTQDPIAVYGWGTYPSHSVLAGQPSKTFLGSYATIEEACKAHPELDPDACSSKWTEPQVSLSHLPGEDDPVPGGMYPDDWDDGE